MTAASQMKATPPLLIHEPPLQVLPGLALTLGLNDAIILQQLHYWLGRSKHLHDGEPWVFNSLAEWHEQFPWWSEDTISRALARLSRKGIVKRAHHSANKWDRTLWYGIDYRVLSSLIPAASRNPLPQFADIEPSSERTSYKEQETTTETSLQETTYREVGAGAPDTEARRVFEQYKARIFPTARTDGRGQIKVRLKKFTAVELGVAIEHFAADAWEMEHNRTRGAPWFFESDARIEHYLNMTPRASQIGRQNGATVRHAERNPEERPHNRFVEFDNV